jgi:transcriptional regulator with XRE-family HTH domain
MKKGPQKKPSGKFGKRVTQLRQYMEWDQEKLAIASDCKREYISKVERNVNNPQLGSIEPIIIKGFGISEKDFHDYEVIPEILKKRKEEEMKEKNKLKQYSKRKIKKPKN